MKPKTWIVCTIGPACRSEKMLAAMMLAGMRVARLNFAHETPAHHAQDMDKIRRISAKLKKPCDILVDLPGPKIRIGEMKKEPVLLRRGTAVRLTTREVKGTDKLLPVDYPQLFKSLKKGGLVFLNDGFLQLKVESIQKESALCRVLVGGSLFSHKGLNLPNSRLFVEPVTDKDLEYLDFAMAHGVDLFGVSFIERDQDILRLKSHAQKQGKKIRTVAKIERSEAVENLDAILKVTDSVMVARGDLGVQIPLEQVPLVQKHIIHNASLHGVPVITATQMLETMVHNIRPTRAEASDVANAILDGTDAVMLSEETAVGDYPVQTIEMMQKIIRAAEESTMHRGLSRKGRILVQ